jgi:tetratricopeptide (TPR) repeat protein
MMMMMRNILAALIIFSSLSDWAALPSYCSDTLAQAQALYANKNFAQALTIYDALHRAQLKSVPILVGRGNCYLQLEDYSKAEADLTAATVLQPQSTEAWIGLGRVFFQYDKYAEAANCAAKALAIEPHNYDALRLKAYISPAPDGIFLDVATIRLSSINDADSWHHILLKAENIATTPKELNEVLAAMKNQLASNSTDQAALMVSAIVLMRLKKSSEALAVCNKALALNPNLVVAYLVRSKIFSHMLEDQKALDDINKAISLSPKFPDLFRERGNLYVDSFNDSTKAAADLNTAISLQEKSDSFFLRNYYFDRYYYWTELGSILNTAHRLPEAVQAFNRCLAIKQMKSQHLTYSRRAGCYLRMKEFDKASHDYGLVLLELPKDVDALQGRADCYIALNRYKNALSDLNKAIAIHPQDSNLYRQRANCYKALGDIKSASESIRIANSLDGKLLGEPATRGIGKSMQRDRSH